MAKRYKLDWRGKATKEALVNRVIIPGLTEFGMSHETAAKAILKPTRGILTGTKQRSLHAAAPSYQFESDDVKPARDTPERSGTGGDAEQEGDVVTIVMGSGLVYANAVNNRWHNIERSHDQVAPLLPGILNDHAGKAGFR